MLASESLRQGYLFIHLFIYLEFSRQLGHQLMGGRLITSANDFHSSISSKTSNKQHLLHVSITKTAEKSITPHIIPNEEEEGADAIGKAKITTEKSWT